ncbi:MAG: aquaporin [Gammaproteobacteria bacterium]|jgi:glycerol uptake facilitator-like aquaporin
MVKKIISEFIGTGMLFCVVVGSGIMGENLSSGNLAIALLANTLATFWALFVLITVLSPISGAHFNPVVSVVMYFKNEITFYLLVIYIFCQLLGSMFGVMLANIMFDLDWLQYSNQLREGSHIFIAEVVASFGLLSVILLSPKDKTALLVGSYIGSAYWFTSSTSFANPAASFGRMFSDTFAGIAPASVPSFMFAQFIGGMLAYAIYKIYKRS